MSKRLLSIQTATLGHATYARLMREFFADAPHDATHGENLELESVWLEDGRDFSTRVLARLTGPQLPGEWARARNADLRRSRNEWVLGKMGRRLVRGGEPFDALHFHTQVAAYGSADVMRRLPSVLTGDMTAAQIEREETPASWGWTHAPSRAMDGRVFRAARAIAMWSQWAARSVVEDYGINARKVHTIYPGVDIEALDAPAPENDAARDALKIEGLQGAERVKILFVGGDFERKGGPQLLDVFAREFAGRAELHLVTGAPVGYNHPAVRVHSGVRAYSPQWLQLFRACDLFVLPTRREAFGLALIEAMALGLPVVSTRLNAIPEIVAHGESGFLVEPGDDHQLAARMRHLIDNNDLRRQMGERGAKIARQKFDARRNFEQLRQLFDKMLADYR